MAIGDNAGCCGMGTFIIIEGLADIIIPHKTLGEKRVVGSEGSGGVTEEIETLEDVTSYGRAVAVNESLFVGMALEKSISEVFLVSPHFISPYAMLGLL